MAQLEAASAATVGTPVRPALTLYVGNRNYSSWSLRAWLGLARTGAPFATVMVPLYRPESAGAIRAVSPTGRLPVLHEGDLVLPESLAILEYAAERFPYARLWPTEAGARAEARAVSAEMHAGFASLRAAMPMNLRAAKPGKGMKEGVAADIARIAAIWEGCRARFAGAGPFLFGPFTNADAMFAPVVGRFRTYGVALPSVARAYAETVWAMPEMQAWVEAARAEPQAMPDYDAL